MNTNALIALALGAWALLRGKKTAAAAPAASTSAPAKRRVPAKPRSRVVTVPEVVVTPGPDPLAIPMSVTQPVSSTAIPWPAVEQQVLNRPQTQSTKREAIPALNVEKHTGSSPQNELAAMVVRERNWTDPDYWMTAKSVKPDEVEQAKAFISIWQKGKVWFLGPRTFAGRRMYKAIESGGKKAITIWQPKPPFGNEPTQNAAKSAPAVPTLRQGSSGNDVAYLQKLLGLSPQDGKFGPNTKAAVVAFQRARSLTPDGIVGRQTWTALGAFR